MEKKQKIHRHPGIKFPVNPILLKDGVIQMMEMIRGLLDEKKLTLLREHLTEMNPVDIAMLLNEFEGTDLVVLFRVLPKDLAAEVFAYMEAEDQIHIVEVIQDTEVKEILEQLFLDDVVDFIEEMPAGVVRKILRNTSAQRRTQINHFLKYEEDSAGSLMTIEFADAKEEMTLRQAVSHLRRVGMKKETIDTIFVIDASRHLKGIVSLRDLILHPEEIRIADIMESSFICVQTFEDQEQVAQKFKDYDLLNMPVVDNENRLVGIITIDDIMDIIDEENTEDFHKMAAMEPNAEAYLKTPIVTLARKRFTWLLVLMLSATITGRIIEGYEEVLTQVAILASFIPMLMDTGGNSGSQSSAMIIRELALGEIGTKDYLKVILKELSISSLTGISLVAVNFIRMLLLTNATFGILITVSITLFITIVIANITGGILPLIAKKLKLDPAVMAGPLITTVVDAFALVIYFMAATWILGI